MLKKIIIPLALCLLIIFSMPVGVFAGSLGYRVNYDLKKPDSVDVGEEFTVSIGYNNTFNHVITYSMHLYYDSEIFEYVSFSDGNVSNCAITPDGDGKLCITFLSFAEIPFDSIVVKELKFKAKKEGKGEFKLDYHDWADSLGDDDLWDSFFDGIPSGANISFFVKSNSKDSVKTYLGDVNNDSKVTASDARKILRYSAKLETIDSKMIVRADVDKNESVNAADARTVLRMSAKIEELREDSEQDYMINIHFPETPLEVAEKTSQSIVGGINKSFYSVEKFEHKIEKIPDTERYKITIDCSAVKNGGGSAHTVTYYLKEKGIDGLISSSKRSLTKKYENFEIVMYVDHPGEYELVMF